MPDPVKIILSKSKPIISGGIKVESLQKIAFNNQIIKSNMLLPRLFSELLVAKSELKIPFTTKEEVTPSTIFTDPKDKIQKYYLPKYKVKEDQINGQKQFMARLVNIPSSGSQFFEITLIESTPKAEMKPLEDISYSCDLVYIKNSGGISKRIKFNDIKKKNQEIILRADLSNLSLYNEIYAALSSTDYSTSINLIKQVKLAYSSNKVQQSKKPIPRPVLNLLQNKLIVKNNRKFRELLFSVQNAEQYPRELFKEKFKIAGRQSITRTVATFFDQDRKLIKKLTSINSKELKSISVLFPISRKLPQKIYLELFDQEHNRKYTSNQVVLVQKRVVLDKPFVFRQPFVLANPVITTQLLKTKESEVLYKVVTKNFEESIEIIFPKELNQNVYATSGAQGAVTSAYRTIELQWEHDNLKYTYIQDVTNPNQIYYLPDEMIIARDEVIPFKPKIQVEFRGDTPESLRAIMRYELAPLIKYERLEQAYEHFKRTIDENVQLDQLEVSNNILNYKLAYPGSEGFQIRNESSIRQISSLQDVLPAFTIPQFDTIVSDLINVAQGGAHQLSGNLFVDLEDLAIPGIPVNIRIDHFSKNLVEGDIEFGDFYEIELKNQNDVSVRIIGMHPQLGTSDSMVEASKLGVELPLVLDSQETKTIVLIPKVELTSENVFAEINFEGLQEKNNQEWIISEKELSIIKISKRKGCIIQISNPIESMLKANLQSVTIFENEKVLPGITFKNFENEIEITPGETYSILAVNDRPLDEENISVAFDWKHISVLPVKEHLLERIVSNKTLNNISFQLKVQLLDELTKVNPAIRVLKVHLKMKEDGPVMEELIFTIADSPSRKDEISLPINLMDFLLQKSNLNNYWMRIVVVISKQEGDQVITKEIMGEWIQGETSHIFISSVNIPKID